MDNIKELKKLEKKLKYLRQWYYSLGNKEKFLVIDKKLRYVRKELNRNKRKELTNQSSKTY